LLGPAVNDILAVPTPVEVAVSDVGAPGADIITDIAFELVDAPALFTA
jgi:hypothetical protein